MNRTTLSERGLVLAPRGRDAVIASAMLVEAGIEATVCPELSTLLAELDRGAGFVVLTEEAIASADLNPLSAWLAAQEEWSDLPFVLLTNRGGGLERNPAAGRHLALLGNVTFLERPFHPTTLVSLAQAALRGRRRQYQARASLEAMREGEARYRTLFEAMDEGFCVIEFIDGPHGPLSDYVHVEANSAYERHSGIRAVVGRKVRDVIGAEADEWIELYRRVLVSGAPIRFERELVATGRHLELAAFRVEPAKRKQVAVLFNDVTERRRADLALQQLNETLERRVADEVAEKRILAELVEGTDSSVQVIDPDFRLLAINNAAVDEFDRLFGVRPQVGDRLLEVLRHRPEEREQLRALWARALAGEQFVAVAELGDPARQRRWFEHKFNVMVDARGRRTGAYLFADDVTEQLEAEAELEAARAQLHEAQKLETLGQLTGGVAHDFNNLLTPITGALDLLQRRYGEDARSARLIDGALQSADRAKTLVSRLLGFARRQALENRPVEIGALIEGMRDLITSSVGSTVELRIEVAPDLPTALADPNQLELAILNLCVNARDAMSDGGTITLTVDRAQVGTREAQRAPPGTYVRVAVVDTGGGMDQATLARAVEPFFSTKGVGRGTGLGLSMVHGLAAQLGGAFALTSQPGLGTRAELYLPLASEEALPIVRPVRVASGLQSLSVLLVDDEELVRTGTAEMLRDLGHLVVEAAGGSQALAELATGAAFDLLVTDYMMPRLNGAELGRIVRRDYPQIAVLIITGYAGGDLDLEFPHLAKPFKRDELAATMQHAMQRDDKVIRLTPRRKS